jgi:hypothetical protein
LVPKIWRNKFIDNPLEAIYSFGLPFIVFTRSDPACSEETPGKFGEEQLIKVALAFFLFLFSTSGAWAQAYITTGTVSSRLPADRSAEHWDALDFGALGTNTATTIGTTYASGQTNTLANFAAISINSATPFAWVTNPSYGLTFTMNTSVAQGSAGTLLTFKESLSGINGWSATVATWQDPAHGNYLVAPGMLVSGSCIAANTTVSSVDRTAGDANYGTITLSQSTSSACANNTAITFTISATQFRALTLDWLGIQAAIAAASGPTPASPPPYCPLTSPSGQAVYIPSGNYVVNHSLINPGCITDTYQQIPNIDVFGDGVATTRIIWNSDLGTDMCGIAEATRGSSSTSLSRYHDFRLIGPFVSGVLGTAPNKMDGICITQTAGIYNIRADSFRAGINGIRDHWFVHHSVLTNNGYGIYFAPYASSIGNQDIDDTDMAGNTIASFGIAATDAIDGSTLTHIHTGFGPYGFYGEAAPTTVSNPISMITNTVFKNVFIEAVGDAWIYGPNNNDVVAGNTFIEGGFSSVGVTNIIASTTPKAVIYVNAFRQNTMIGTNWSQYGNNGTSNYLADAIIEVTGTNNDCSNNAFYNDVGFISGPTTTSNTLMKCPNGVLQNRFYTSIGDGIIMSSATTLAVSVPVYNSGNNTAKAYADGLPFAGITAAPTQSGTNVSVPVFTYSSFINAAVKTSSSQLIATGQALFATAGGVAGGIDSGGAIGTAFFGSSSGTATVSMSLDPGAQSNGQGVATGLTAAGTTQGTAYVITSSVDQFTTVTTGTGAILPANVFNGRGITVYNRGANALKVYPPVGAKIESNATNAAVTLAAGADAIFRPISATQWLQ